MTSSSTVPTPDLRLAMESETRLALADNNEQYFWLQGDSEINAQRWLALERKWWANPHSMTANDAYFLTLLRGGRLHELSILERRLPDYVHAKTRQRYTFLEKQVAMLAYLKKYHIQSAQNSREVFIDELTANEAIKQYILRVADDDRNKQKPPSERDTQIPRQIVRLYLSPGSRSAIKGIEDNGSVVHMPDDQIVKFQFSVFSPGLMSENQLLSIRAAIESYEFAVQFVPATHPHFQTMGKIDYMLPWAWAHTTFTPYLLTPLALTGMGMEVLSQAIVRANTTGLGPGHYKLLVAAFHGSYRVPFSPGLDSNDYATGTFEVREHAGDQSD